MEKNSDIVAVSDIMSKGVMSVDALSTIQDAAKIMEDTKNWRFNSNGKTTLLSE